MYNALLSCDQKTCFERIWVAKEGGFEVHLRYVRCPERCETVDGPQSDFSFMATVQEIAIKLKRSIERSLDDSPVSGVISLRMPTIFVVYGYL